MVALGVCFTSLWGYIYRTDQLHAGAARSSVIRVRFIRAAAGTVAYAVGTALVFVEPRISLGVFALLVVVFIVDPPS